MEMLRDRHRVAEYSGILLSETSSQITAAEGENAAGETTTCFLEDRLNHEWHIMASLVHAAHDEGVEPEADGTDYGMALELQRNRTWEASMAVMKRCSDLGNRVSELESELERMTKLAEAKAV